MKGFGDLFTTGSMTLLLFLDCHKRRKRRTISTLSVVQEICKNNHHARRRSDRKNQFSFVLESLICVPVMDILWIRCLFCTEIFLELASGTGTWGHLRGSIVTTRRLCVPMVSENWDSMGFVESIHRVTFPGVNVVCTSQGVNLQAVVLGGLDGVPGNSVWQLILQCSTSVVGKDPVLCMWPDNWGLVVLIKESAFVNRVVLRRKEGNITVGHYDSLAIFGSQTEVLCRW